MDERAAKEADKKQDDEMASDEKDKTGDELDNILGGDDNWHDKEIYLQ